MVLYGNNYNWRVTPYTICFSAALLANIQQGLEEPTKLCFLPFLLLGLAVSFTAAHVAPVPLKNLWEVQCGAPGAVFELAQSCMRAKKDFWSCRQWIFWGPRTCILTSEKSVKDVLTFGEVFQRSHAPDSCITSAHSVLGAGGVTKTWKRLRTVCEPFFKNAEFEKQNEKVRDHIINAVSAAAEKSTEVNWFQLINRLVVEIHLMVILGVDFIPVDGMFVAPASEGDPDQVCMADAIDESLLYHGHAPHYTTKEFAPVLNYLTERLQLPTNQLAGIEKILQLAKEKGEINTVERLHNIIMFMIALAPSPASFWATVHIFQDKEILDAIRSESQEGKFNTLCKSVKETLRMYAPVPIAVERFVVNEETANHVCLLEGSMALNKGDRVIIPTIVIQNDPDLWLEPDKFNPSRWEDIVIEDLNKNDRMKLMMRIGSGIQLRPVPQANEVMKARYFPFGMGKHTCMGQPYAVWLTMTIVNTILNEFDVEIRDPSALMSEAHAYRRIKSHTYSFPKSALTATISRRKTDRAAMRKSYAAMTINMNRMSVFVMNTAGLDGIDESESESESK